MRLLGYYYILTSGAITSTPPTTSTRLDLKLMSQLLRRETTAIVPSEISTIDFNCLTYLASLYRVNRMMHKRPPENI